MQIMFPNKENIQYTYLYMKEDPSPSELMSAGGGRLPYELAKHLFERET